MFDAQGGCGQRLRPVPEPGHGRATPFAHVEADRKEDCMARTVPVVFSHATALEILRRLPPEMLEQRSRLRQWPQYPVGRAQLDAAVARIEELFPASFEIGRPPVRDQRPETSRPPVRRALQQPVHFVTGCTGQNRSLPSYTGHLTQQGIPERSLIKIADGIWICAPELVFVQMATCIGRMALIELGFELCGTYRTPRSGAPSSYDSPALTSAAALEGFLARTASIPGERRVRRCVKRIADGAASPREAKLFVLLSFPKSMGGYGLGQPVMNLSIPTDEEAFAICRKSHLKCDITWPGTKIDLEYQSRFAHEGEQARISDSRRANALAAMGWTVIGITNEEMDSISACDALADRLRSELKIRKRPEPHQYERLKNILRWELGLPAYFS